MSKSPRALQEVITAVDAGHHAVHVNVESASSLDSSKHLGPRRHSTYNGRGAGAGARKSAPGVAVVEASTDASFEFSTAVVSYSSASPASMVFSDGQLRAHQFPAVRSASASARSSQQPATSPVRSSSTGSYSTKQRAGVTGSTKRVSFATDGPDKAGGGQGKKSGGLLGCMGSTCGPSLRNEAVVEPVARNDNRKVVAF